MMRSMWSAVAGLKTHQLEMDVIGNNIANVNTTAYKSQATGFQDVLYQTVKEGTGAGQRVAATNIAQVGLGSRLGSVYTNISAQGSAITTNNVMDLMITGPSFFIISPDSQILNYGRDGSFSIDAEGDLVTQNNGYYVMGVMGDGGVADGAAVSKLRLIDRQAVTEVDADGNITTRMADIMPGSATSEAYFKGNFDEFDPSLEEGKIQSLEVYGNDGQTYTLKFRVTDNADTDNSTYKLTIDQILDSNGNKVENTSKDNSVLLTYNKNDGKLQGVSASSINYVVGENEVHYGEEGNLEAVYFGISGNIGDSTFDKTVPGMDGKDYTLHFSIKYDSYEKINPEDRIIYSFTLEGITDENGNKYPIDPLVDYGIYGAETGNFSSGGHGEGGLIYYEIDNPHIRLFYSLLETTLGVSNETSKDHTFTFAGDAAKIGPLHIDFSNTTNYGSEMNNHSSTIYAYKGDTKGLNKGYANGELTGLSFGTDGSVYGTYSNGQTIKKAQIAVAEFSNAMGLEKVGDNLYQASLNSGAAMIQDITKDGGYMNSGVLEGSNIDLAKEFTDMITTQRGFQANSRVITTSDEMLQILKGLKR